MGSILLEHPPWNLSRNEIQIMENEMEAPNNSNALVHSARGVSFMHLSDLHVGMTNQGWLWPAFKKAFLDDSFGLSEESFIGLLVGLECAAYRYKSLESKDAYFSKCSLESEDTYFSNLNKCFTSDYIASELVVAVMTVCGSVGCNINLLDIFDIYMDVGCGQFELSYVPNSKESKT